jgi:large subunit ribosomal protein L18
VQFIDDSAGRTLASATTAGKSATGAGVEKVGANVANAKKIGRLAADVARAKGIEKVVFDRGGARYHGKVKALADAAREAGLKL